MIEHNFSQLTVCVFFAEIETSTVTTVSPLGIAHSSLTVLRCPGPMSSGGEPELESSRFLRRRSGKLQQMSWRSYGCGVTSCCVLFQSKVPSTCSRTRTSSSWPGDSNIINRSAHRAGGACSDILGMAPVCHSGPPVNSHLSQSLPGRQAFERAEARSRQSRPGACACAMRAVRACCGFPITPCRLGARVRAQACSFSRRVVLNLT